VLRRSGCLKFGLLCSQVLATKGKVPTVGSAERANNVAAISRANQIKQTADVALNEAQEGYRRVVREIRKVRVDQDSTAASASRVAVKRTVCLEKKARKEMREQAASQDLTAAKEKLRVAEERKKKVRAICTFSHPHPNRTLNCTGTQAEGARSAAKIQRAKAQARRETSKKVRHKASLRLEAQLKLNDKKSLAAAQLAYENANAEVRFVP
jgi:hypothetical protein